MPDLSHHIHSVSGPNCNLCLYGTLHSRQFTGFTTCWSKSFTAPSAEDQDQAMVMTQLPGLADLLAKCQSSDAFIATCIIKKPLQDVHGRGGGGANYSIGGQRNQFKPIALMLAHYKCTTSTLTATTKDVGFSTIFELFLT